MGRKLLVAAVAGALALPAASRHFQLEGGLPEGVRRIIVPIKNLSLDGESPTTWETITRTGDFWDERYGDFSITRQMLLQMVSNFEKGTYGQEIFIDVAHRHNDGAAAQIIKLTVEGNRLRALLGWTPYGAEQVKNRGYRYFSAEFHDNWTDPEKKAHHGALLMGAGLTIRPVIKGLDPIDGSRIRLSLPDNAPPTFLSPELHTLFLTETQAMWKQLIEALKVKLGTFKLSEAFIAQLLTLAEATVGKTTDETAAKALIAAIEASGKQLAEEVAKAGVNPITLTLAVPDSFKQGMSEAEVKKLMEQMAKDGAAAAKQLQETLGAKVKLLTETIGAAAGIPDEMKKDLTAAVADLVTPDMTDDQVKRLAAAQVASGNRIIAAQSLASMGYPLPAGTVHLTVDSSNQIKELQDEVDKRIFKGVPAHKRYRLSEGQLITGNKEIVEACLALYDRDNAVRLHDDYKRIKKLAGGDSLVSDVAVPASFERTVIREALYQLVGLGLCDVGTANFAAVVQLPYSYRDTAGAGIGAARKYEGQAIARAAVKQALEEARPIPQKLAFEVSDELRYLAGNGQINFDIVSENALNASRIVGEDTEKLLFDEHLNASDQFATAAIVAEAVANGDAAKTIFILNQFPVVRPKKIFDLQGVQVGATLYPHTVSINAVNTVEYDFTNAQGAGTYFYMDYNLGEIHFVNQLGVPTAPGNGLAIVSSYTYTTNVFKWDSDLGALKVDEKYDDFLYRFGLRKAAIEDRSHMANVGIMSGTLRTQIEQARQFGANFKRAGTDLMADGNLGRIKDVPSFRSYAPGLAVGDQRVVIGERGTVRFRMLKGWTLGQLENQKDANGRYTGKKEAYGDQFIVVNTPALLKSGLTSIVVYGAAARVDRV